MAQRLQEVGCLSWISLQLKSTKGSSALLCLDETTGRVLWTREWEADYTGLSYAIGPRATPTADGDRVYALGASGILLCLRVKDGAILWKKDFVNDYGTQLPVWGMTGAPLVDGQRLIALVGGAPDAKVVAFDKMTGKEIWRSLPSRRRDRILPARSSSELAARANFSYGILRHSPPWTR